MELLEAVQIMLDEAKAEIAWHCYSAAQLLIEEVRADGWVQEVYDFDTRDCFTFSLLLADNRGFF